MSSRTHTGSVRRRRDPYPLNHRAALQQIRDALPPTPGARRAEPSPTVVRSEVPAELVASVGEHARHAGTYLNQAVAAGRTYGQCRAEWQRLVLYALTDGLAHLHLAIGTVAAECQQQGMDDAVLRRLLQSPDPDRYVTQHALDHLAGLQGQPVEDGRTQPVWHFIGERIAQTVHERQQPS